MAIETVPTCALPELWTPRTEIDEIVIPAFVELTNNRLAWNSLVAASESLTRERRELLNVENFKSTIQSDRIKNAVNIVIDDAIFDEIDAENRELQEEKGYRSGEKNDIVLRIAAELQRGTITITPLVGQSFKKERVSSYLRALTEKWHSGPVTGDVTDVDEKVRITLSRTLHRGREYHSQIRPVFANPLTLEVEQNVSFSRV